MSAASEVAGRWQLEIRTPVGKQSPVVTLVVAGGQLTGTAHDKNGPTDLRDVAFEAPALTWSQSVTRPMRLELSFELVVDGDQLHGFARAGRLPASRVTGRRLIPVDPSA